MNRFSVVLCAMLSVAALAGCTAQEWYDNSTESAKRDCERMQPGAREQCLSTVNKMPYDRYTKEREKQSRKD